MRSKFSGWYPVIVLAVILLLLPAAFYLAGAFYFASHKINPLKADVFSWIDYFLKDNSDRKKQWSALLGAFFAIYVLIPLGLYLATRTRRELHGSARFANAGEIAKANLLQPARKSNHIQDDGIVVGSFNDRILRFTGQQFVLLAAPTRSGKGVGVVIPNCLSWPHSLVVLDIKQENFNLTSGYRRKVLGQQVFLFNPFAEEADANGKATPVTHCWNPFDNIARGLFRVGELMNLGRSFFPQTGDKDEFWNNLALNLFMAITLFLFELREENERRDHENQGNDDLPRYAVTIGEVLRQSSGKGQPLKKYLTSLLKDYGDDDNGGWLSGECKDLINEFLSSSDDVLASILSTFNAPLGIWRNPIVDAATSKSDFDLKKVREERITIYIGVKPNQLPNAAKIINLLFSQLVNINTKELPQDHPKLKYPCLLLMDEFTAIGKVPIIAKAVSYIAGYNLRLLPIIQSVAQLESVYGKEDARTFVTNHAMQILYAPREQKDANEFSEMLGYFTEKSSSVSRPKGLMGGGKSGISESVSDQRRALLLPQEFKELGMWKEVIMLENTKPILCDKIKYFDDPYFTQRLIGSIDVAPIDMDQFIEATRKASKVRRPVNERDIDQETDRILENKQAQLAAITTPEDIPPNTGSDDDFFNHGSETIQINTVMNAEQSQVLKSAVWAHVAKAKAMRENQQTESGPRFIASPSSESVNADIQGLKASINDMAGFMTLDDEDDGEGTENSISLTRDDEPSMPQEDIDHGFAA